MPRPTTKQELLDLSQKNYQKLLNYIDSQPDEKQVADFPVGTLNRNVRDVLAHLHEWHNMMQRWYNEGMAGQNPDIPAVGYTWKTTGDLNREINQQFSATPLPKVRELLENSHQQVVALIEKHTNDELFEKNRYKWTGTTSLGAYLISATSSHYDWALKLIKKSLKGMK
ncbi:MAG: ClbS/DfsB family four-helix bundle protein [Bacteroidetes bacterium]|nr:ClbS/DfsB family four-helix bundle protein [Bacteroidota bacterium]